ncbi:MAG: amino acid adenylation domain-containing protein [Planctomycetota bacterium]
MNAGDPRDTLDAIFARAVAAHPEAIAIEVPPGRERPERLALSYRALEERVRRLASAIDAATPRDAGPESLVGLLLPRTGPDLVAAQIAATRLGRPWVFLDPAAPLLRSRSVVEDGGVSLVVCERAGEEHAAALGAPTRLLVEDASSGPAAVAPSRARPDSAAYLVFTSGTSGRPKGVVIEQHSIAHLVRSDVATFGLGPGDRVAQGSSAAYDSYLEELWLALSVGATAVVLDEETLRLGPDLPAFLRRERITVLCPPPTLLRTMGPIDPLAELPELRLLYVGGEALPPDLAARWAPGRRLENGYGPTECTVTVMRATIAPEGPVTIGEPIVGHRALVLDEALEPVGPEEAGELCLSGPGLARGYRGDAALTAAKFPLHPRWGRIYRTGDLVRRDARGRHHYLGRIDAQVKIRGHRVELEEIEAQLAAREGVREAACRVDEGILVAWIVPDRVAPDLDRLRTEIAARLPEVMRPAVYEIVPGLPRSVGGKLDRRALERTVPSGDAELATDEGVALVQTAFAAALGRADAPPPAADFFLALGGHSLAAALAVSRLREDPRGRDLAVRDLYEAPTAERLARRLRVCAAAPGADAPRRAESRAVPERGGRLVAASAQAVALALILLLAGGLADLLLRFALPWALETATDPIGLLALLGAGLGLGAIGTSLSVILLLAAKWTLVGRYRAGRFPAWRSFHVRHWLVRLAASAVPFGLLRGTGLELALLRRLGARLGRGVHVERGVDLMRGGWDLLEVGEGAVLGRDAELRTIVLEDGALRAAAVAVGEGAVLETRAGLAPGARLGAGARLTALSLVESGGDVAARRRADGIPARETGDASHDDSAPPGWSPARFRVSLATARVAVAIALALPGLAAALVLADRWGLASSSGWTLGHALRAPREIAGLALLVAGLGLADLALRAILCRGLGPIRPGRVARRSGAVLRHELKVGLVEGAGRTLSGTIFWPGWLRAAGMRIGAGSEVSSIMDVPVELVSIGPGSFLADGVYLGGPRHEAAAVTFGPTRLGSGTFVGNHAVISADRSLPDGVLLGISTAAPETEVEPGSSWFGHPPFPLPRREEVDLDPSLTHHPSPRRRLVRFTWEALRLLVPLPPLLVGLVVLALFHEAQLRLPPAVSALVAGPVLLAAAGATLALLVLGLKWLLLGRTRPGRHGLWSGWCSRWDFLYVAWQAWAVPVLGRFEGTPFLAPWLRAMGVRLGRRVLLGDGFAQVVDPDMLVIEDEATVEGLFQAHSFEDRVLKTEPLRIGRRAGTGFGSVMLYGADLGEGARLAPHSVAMKRERLEARAEHVGAPTRRHDLGSSNPDESAPG